MATFRHFEEIEAWQQARDLNRAVYHVTRSGLFSRDRALKDPIRRASVSVMSNIAEGFERGTRAQFIHFLVVAKGSAGEVESQLYTALDQAYITEEEFRSVKMLAVSTKRLIAGLMQYLERAGNGPTKAAPTNRKPRDSAVETSNQQPGTSNPKESHA